MRVVTSASNTRYKTESRNVNTEVVRHVECSRAVVGGLLGRGASRRTRPRPRPAPAPGKARALSASCLAAPSLSHQISQKLAHVAEGNSPRKKTWKRPSPQGQLPETCSP